MSGETGVSLLNVTVDLVTAVSSGGDWWSLSLSTDLTLAAMFGNHDATVIKLTLPLQQSWSTLLHL